MLPDIFRELFLIENYNILSGYSWAFIFAIVNLLAALQVYLVYYFSINRIKSSSQGLSQLSDMKYPKDLIGAIRLYLFSILSIPILNMISNLSGLIIHDCTLNIGFNSFWGIFILIFLLHGLYRLANELFNIDTIPNNRFINNYSKIHFIFSLILMLTLFTNVLLIHKEYMNHLIILLATVYSLVIAINMKRVHKISWIRAPNPVRKIRFRILIFNYYIIVIALITELLIRTLSSTSDPWVEKLGFVFDGFIILLLLNFYLLIFLPKSFRRVIKISNQELTFYKDVRIDGNVNLYKWYQLSLGIPRIQEFETPHNSNFIIFHSFIEKEKNQICQALGNTFGTKYAMNPSGYNEEFFKNEILPKSNLFFLLDPSDPFLTIILNRIYLDYNFNIQFNPNLCINNFKYIERNEKFVPFFITPVADLNSGSTFNNQKSWTIIAEEKYHSIISDFINDYYPYFQGVSKEYVVICILKFPVVDGQIKNIPSGRKLYWPDFNYLIFL